MARMAVENSSSLFPSEPPGDLQTRIGLLFALFFISGVCSLIPVCGAWYTRLRSKRKGSATKEAAEEKPWKQVLLGFLNCFAGGVFLGVTFLHLLPDITEEWEKIFNKVLKTSYPLDKFLVVIGFFMVLVIEQMAYACQSSKPKNKEERVVPTPAIRTIRIQPNIVASLSRNIEATPLLGGGEGVDCKQCRQEHAHHTQPEVASDSEGEPTHHRSLLRKTSVRYSSPDIVEVDNNEVNGGTGDEGEGKGAQKKNEATTPGGLRAVFLGMALSVHSVFEGLAFGLIQSESDAIQVFLGIAIHKAVIGLSLGIALVSTQTHFLLALVLMLIFVVSSPIGIAVGLSLSHFTESTETAIARAVLQALACGTFTYITFLELIGHEFANIHPSTRKHRLMLVFACLLGFGLLAGLAFMEG